MLELARSDDDSGWVKFLGSDKARKLRALLRLFRLGGGLLGNGRLALLGRGFLGRGLLGRRLLGRGVHQSYAPANGAGNLQDLPMAKQGSKSMTNRRALRGSAAERPT